MSKEYERLAKCYESVKRRISFQPDIALVLGSGLGDFAEGIQMEACLDYKDIGGFPVSTAPGHKGRFVFGTVKGVRVVAMQGRVHCYEGYPVRDVVLPIRLMKLMGAKALMLTNAAGGINEGYQAGDFMLLKDQISCFVESPLIGENVEELGPRFCDMSEVYDRDLRGIIKKTAEGLGIPLKEGIYVQLKGPNFETPAEIRMLRGLGADAVGMSTACEAVAANHMGMKICGISCISNMGSGMTENPLSQQEVEETARRAAPLFKRLLTESIVNIAGSLE
ncbi:MAG: purine-nucleoside phosphorylase [Lachnospiraceae bacterium]